MTVETIHQGDPDSESRGEREAEELLEIAQASILEERRQQVAGQYSEFKPVVDGLKIVRLPLGDGPVRPINQKLEGAVRGLGVRGLEQVVAASAEEGVFVSERVPGAKIRKLALEQKRQVTDKQLGDLVRTVVEANALGLRIDVDQGNILYDKDAGFGIVDYWHQEGNQQNLADTLGYLAGSLNNMGRAVWGEDVDEREAYQCFGTALLTHFEQQCAQILDPPILMNCCRAYGD